GLAYHYVLSHHDAAWRLAAEQTKTPLPPIWTLVAGLGSFAAVAAFGVRPSRLSDPGERMLVVWPLAALVLYLTVDEVRFPFLRGVSLPLAVLAVRGWPVARPRPVLAAAALAACTLPGLVYQA